MRKAKTEFKQGDAVTLTVIDVSDAKCNLSVGDRGVVLGGFYDFVRVKFDSKPVPCVMSNHQLELIQNKAE